MARKLQMFVVGWLALAVLLTVAIAVVMYAPAALVLSPFLLVLVAVWLYER